MKRPYPLDFKDMLDQFAQKETRLNLYGGSKPQPGPSDELDAVLREHMRRERERAEQGAFVGPRASTAERAIIDVIKRRPGDPRQPQG